MDETLEGTGRLESIRDATKVWQVRYHFEIKSTYSRKTAGGVGVRVDRKWSEGGTVVSLDEKPVPEGEYTLNAENEILRVDHFDGLWTISGGQ
jgi:hypothetical protein